MVLAIIVKPIFTYQANLNDAIILYYRVDFLGVNFLSDSLFWFILIFVFLFIQPLVFIIFWKS